MQSYKKQATAFVLWAPFPPLTDITSVPHLKWSMAFFQLHTRNVHMCNVYALVIFSAGKAHPTKPYLATVEDCIEENDRALPTM